MTIPQESTPEQAQQQVTEKELNFRKQEAMFKRQLDEERAARAELERKIALMASSSVEEDSSDEPYVDEKRLNKKLANFERTMEEKIDKKAEQKASMLIEQERRAAYLKENSDFNSVMREDIVQKFAEAHPRLAENILRMPDGFERQKLVYENIKALGVDKPVQKQPTIQEKIDANRRSPYYQPSGVGTSPYANNGDFSANGQKNAYQQMQDLKNRLRLG